MPIPSKPSKFGTRLPFSVLQAKANFYYVLCHGCNEDVGTDAQDDVYCVVTVCTDRAEAEKLANKLNKVFLEWNE